MNLQVVCRTAHSSRHLRRGSAVSGSVHMKPRDANDILREQVRSNEVRAAPSRPASWSDRRLILSSAGFVQGFVPPDYVIFGLLQRRFLYSITGKTGAGKTAILLLIAAHVAEGKKIVDRDVEKGRVVYLAG